VAGVVLVLAGAGPIPAARSVRGTAIASVLAGHAGQQASGYAVLGLAFLGPLLLVVWKRARRVAGGDVMAWRTAHALTGAAALAVLAVHTGLRLGHHLNRALMVDFLVLSLLGAGAAVVTGRRGSRWWSRAHVALFLPLPVLVALHVLAAYYY
jgi:nitrite reductase (NADH) large subunit